METRIDDLEIRLTYQESTIEELNQVILRQQTEIDRLARELERLKTHIENSHSQTTPTDERPPHY
ncbi:MAG: SlyX family protein [Gammaproteobacteria bacterium]|nr:SlyX family protein [Gammaproteobacteria bacterium]MDH5693922.1 SlyX family protein [Gammaproteobacteria bacterium]